MKPTLSSRDLSLLQPAFREKVELLLERCADQGAVLKPFFTVRGPAVQAKLWCQSRSPLQIQAQANALEAAGASWLASLLQVSFAHTGPKVTNALPGLSWHQWGEAIDCYVAGPQGQAIWNARHPGYRLYAETAVELGLEAGGLWKRFPDAVHVQWQAHGSPLRAGLTWAEIDSTLRARFSA
ncbi:MAG: M15 family metallopeptidase [Bryobacter sp.]|nr:M15 family metallopeptidase [Bryobacter sp.]